MSVIPEYILQTTIVRGIKRMRNDSSLIDQLFRNLDQKNINQIRLFLKQHAIDLAINYPRSTLKVPAIVLLLKAEKERHAFLGDFLGIEDPDEFSYDGGVDGEFLTGAASIAPISSNPKVIFGPFTAFTGTENTLRITTNEWIAQQFLQQPTIVRIVSGNGVGQIRTITANSKNVLMVDPPWTNIPDETSVFQITIQPPEVLGEPSSLYNRRDPSFSMERRGGIYDLTYQIQVIGPNPELTIYLSIILKSIFTQFRLFMEGQGIIDLRMSATDFAPRPEYQPDLTYMRAINMDFAFPFDIFEAQEGIVRSFRLCLDVEPEDPTDGEQVASSSDWSTEGGSLINPLSDVQRVYFGVAQSPITYDANFVQNVIGGQGSAIASKRQRFINFTSGPGQKMYYVLPVRFAGINGNFIDTGTLVEAGFIIAATIPITTSFGTEVYNIWESENANLAFVSLQVT